MRLDGRRSDVVKDQLDYMSDLLLELRDMARANRLATLAGLLDVAHGEARLRAGDQRDRH